MILSLEEDVADLVKAFKQQQTKDVRKGTRLTVFTEKVAITDTLQQPRIHRNPGTQTLTITDTLRETGCIAYQIETNSPPDCGFKIAFSEIGLGADVSTSGGLFAAGDDPGATRWNTKVIHVLEALPSSLIDGMLRNDIDEDYYLLQYNTGFGEFF